MSTEPKAIQDNDLEVLCQSIDDSIREGDRVGAVTADELRRSIAEARDEFVREKRRSGVPDQA